MRAIVKSVCLQVQISILRLSRLFPVGAIFCFGLASRPVFAGQVQGDSAHSGGIILAFLTTCIVLITLLFKWRRSDAEQGFAEETYVHNIQKQLVLDAYPIIFWRWYSRESKLSVEGKDDELMGVYEYLSDPSTRVERFLSLVKKNERRKVIKIFRETLTQAPQFTIEIEIFNSGNNMPQRMSITGERIITPQQIMYCGTASIVSNVISDVNPPVANDKTASPAAPTIEAVHSLFMQQVFDVVPYPIYVKDSAHRYRLVNGAFCKLYGVDRAFAIGATDADIMPKQEADLMLRDDQHLFEQQEDIENEYEVCDSYGIKRHMIVRKSACITSGGETLVVGMTTDVTELRRAEIALRTALDRYSALLTNAPLGMALVDESNKFILVNPYFCDLTGYTQESLAHLRFVDLLPDALHSVDRQIEKGMTQSGYGKPFELQLICGDGKIIPIRSRRIKVVDAVGRVVTWHLIEDLSSLKEASTALSHSEARWQFALEGAGDGVWDWNIQANEMYFSPQWKKMLGYEEEEIRSSLNEWLAHLHPEDAAEVRNAIDLYLRGDSAIFCAEYRMRCKNGQYKWVLGRGKIIEQDASNQPARMIGTHTDICDRKRVEEELMRHRDRLWEMVREQTVDIRKAKEDAERANEAKSVFLANMSHELRTPLHAVLSFAKLGESRFAEGKPSDAQLLKLRDYFLRITNSGERLLMLLNDLLDLSKLEAGRMHLEKVPLNIVEVIHEALIENEALLESKRIRVERRVASNLPKIFADAVRIGQVIRNLMSNAIKFTPPDRRIICIVQTSGEDEVIKGVEIVIADEGIGIPIDELESVFDKFVQSTKTRTGAGGTGLGLSICREIVLAHHGRIYAKQNEFGGASFVVVLPGLEGAIKSTPQREAIGAKQ